LVVYCAGSKVVSFGDLPHVSGLLIRMHQNCDYPLSTTTMKGAVFRGPTVWDTLCEFKVREATLRDNDDQNHDKVLAVLLPYAL
jgi:hypothetical protein